MKYLNCAGVSSLGRFCSDVVARFTCSTQAQLQSVFESSTISLTQLPTWQSDDLSSSSSCMANQWHFNFTFDVTNKRLLWMFAWALSNIQSPVNPSFHSMHTMRKFYLHSWMDLGASLFLLKIISCDGLSILLFWIDFFFGILFAEASTKILWVFCSNFAFKHKPQINGAEVQIAEENLSSSAFK